MPRVDISKDSAEHGEGLVPGQVCDGLVEGGRRRDERQRVVLDAAFDIMEGDQAIDVVRSSLCCQELGGGALNHRPGFLEVGKRRPPKLQ